MTRPRIAIPTPTSVDESYNQRSWPNYAVAVERAGGEPVQIRLSQPDRVLRELTRSCSGILLPGSPADVAPSRYGAETDPATNPADPAREATDWILLEEAERYSLPVLGICFGIQSLNVFHGGSLVQDLLPLPVNHSAGSKVMVAHTAEIASNSLLGSLLTSAPAASAEAPVLEGFLRLPVNSSHHQAIASPGDGLRIVARCPQDSVIEAIEGPYDSNHPEDSRFLLGVQWHPERSIDFSPSSVALFARLVAEAARVAAQPSSVSNA